jgi:hypothetical protein
VAKATDWYKDLEGKEFVWENSVGEICPAIVTGFDYYLGYTFQAARKYDRFSKGEYLTCYRGPISPLKHTGKAKQNAKHRKAMACAAKMVRKGKYDDRQVNMIIYNRPVGGYRGPSAATCVFAQ